ncbi:helix-turn-helix domain-containing protein [Streptomyces sp. DT190]|uniref:helix-turn-helix domain-containing protein n=1 Tax=unclassified Streptomyces TaxID=2593676 RepID=UPI003CEA83E7
MSESTAAGEFAALLGELKERSGLSYGVLAKRLHMSTSTLHRYCNGDAVPADYAPVERLARLCKASPRELVELHRRWVLADAGRGRKGGADASRTAGSKASADVLREASAEMPTEVSARDAAVDQAPVPDAPVDQAPVDQARAEGRPSPDAGDRRQRGRAETAPEEGAAGGAGDQGEKGAGEGGPGSGPSGEGRPEASVAVPPGGAGTGRRRVRRPRPAVLAGAALAVVLGGVGLAVAVPSGGTDSDGRRGSAAVTDGAARPHASTVASVSPSGRPSSGSAEGEEGKDKNKGKGKATASSTPSVAATGTARPGRDVAPAPATGPAPLTVDTEPHAWMDGCSQRYLVNLPPERVVPPPLEQDAPGWVAAMDAVPSGQQLLKVTVQGTGDETVVLKGLTVRMAGKRVPLAWNDYAMGYPGVGCGGGVPTRFFTVALDAARPAVVPEAGHKDFPFKVSDSDPEVYYIQADASAYDVSWYLELRWSSGSRQGTLTVDDAGRPFRTSGNNGRPAYEFPLGGRTWVKEGTTDLS